MWSTDAGSDARLQPKLNTNPDHWIVRPVCNEVSTAIKGIGGAKRRRRVADSVRCGGGAAWMADRGLLLLGLWHEQHLGVRPSKGTRVSR